MKFIGSKSKIAKYILPFLDKALDEEFSSYWEPFCGGCNMIDKIDSKYSRYASDGNPYLIAMWNALQRGWEPPDSLTKEEYQAVKTLKDKNVLPDEYVGFVGHNCSFSGDWFAGYAGTGETRNRCGEAKRHLLKQIKQLKDVYFYYDTYSSLYNTGFKNHVIYCDPPYYEGFKYKGSDFDFQHEYFWEWCRVMSKDNRVFISDYYAPEDFELIWEQEVNVNAHQTKQKKATERLYRIK